MLCLLEGLFRRFCGGLLEFAKDHAVSGEGRKGIVLQGGLLGRVLAYLSLFLYYQHDQVGGYYSGCLSNLVGGYRLASHARDQVPTGRGLTYG